MSMEPITVDVERDTWTRDASGGRTAVSATVYSGLSVTISRPDKSSDTRFESTPGVQTKVDRVVFLEPWDGSVLIEVNDRIVPNPAISYLPAHFNVLFPRPYPDDGGQLQLDVEDVN